MTKTTTTCDHCQSDLSDAGSMPSYRICLSSERIPNLSSGGFMYSVHVSPPFPVTLHFCNRSCLFEYLKPKTETTP